MLRLAFGMAAMALMIGSHSPGAGFAMQDDDDWEYVEDDAQDVKVAAVRYENGTAVVARCADGAFSLLVNGLPAVSETSRTFDATRADGVSQVQTWKVGEGGALSSNLPGRDTRFIRAGGLLRLRSVAGEGAPVSVSLDLPTAHANLDRVLTACRYPLADDRDQLPLADPDIRLTRDPPRGARGGIPGRSLEISCLVRDGQYRDCRIDRSPQRIREGSRATSRWNGMRVHPDDAAANEGRVVHVFVPLLIMVYH